MTNFTAMFDVKHPTGWIRTQDKGSEIIRVACVYPGPTYATGGGTDGFMQITLFDRWHYAIQTLRGPDLQALMDQTDQIVHNTFLPFVRWETKNMEHNLYDLVWVRSAWPTGERVPSIHKYRAKILFRWIDVHGDNYYISPVDWSPRQLQTYGLITVTNKEIVGLIKASNYVRQTLEEVDDFMSGLSEGDDDYDFFAELDQEEDDFFADLED